MPETSEPYRSYRRLLSYSLAHWKIFTISIIGMIVVAGTDTALAAYMKPLMDGSFVDKDPEVIKTMPWILIGIFVVRVFAMFFSLYGMSWVGRKVIKDLRGEMFSRLMQLPKSFYDKATTGSLISKFTFDIEQVANASTKVLTTLIRDSFTVIGLIAWMIYLNAMLAAMFLIAGPFLILLVSYVSKKFRKVSRRIQGSVGDFSKILEEAIKGQMVVKLFGGREYEETQFNEINEHNRRQNMRLIATLALSTPIMRLIVGIALAGVIYVATSDSMREVVTVGTFTSYMVAMAMLFAPIKRLADINAELQRGVAAADSVFNLVDLENEADTGTYEIDRVSGDVQYDNVSFVYETGTNNALSSINLHIKAGQTVAFVGRSGSGKSTLLNLLPRFYDLSSGCIKLDGHDIREYKLHSLRSQFSYVGQDVVLFNDTIANNISYGELRGFELDDIVRAAKAAHADEFIANMANGYDTVVGERGVMLSGGQRQRIAIARALLKNAPILILDEATSALDSESERYIQASFEELKKNRTTLVIAHRLSTIEKADVIVVMDHGGIVETGNHESLMREGKYYFSLHQTNFQETESISQ